MKILHLTTHLNRGGIVQYVTQLSHECSKRGHNICVASSGGDLSAALRQYGIEHIRLPLRTKNELSWRVWYSYGALRRRLERSPVDIIHAHTRVAQVVASLLSRRTGIPFVTTCHGFFKPRWHRRRWPCWGDRTIAISQSVKGHLIRDFRIAEERIRLIHHGIDVHAHTTLCDTATRQALRRELRVPQDAIVIGSAGRFSDVKGLEYLIQAAPLVLHEHPHAVFILIGRGKHQPALEQLINRLIDHGHVEKKHIRLVEPRQSLKDYYCILDVFVMPSRQEGLGLSILEAQAQRIPVVASNVGGIPDLITDKQTGLLVPPEESNALARALIYAVAHPHHCQEMVEAAYQRLLQQFTVDTMVVQTESLYQELV